RRNAPRRSSRPPINAGRWALRAGLAALVLAAAAAAALEDRDGKLVSQRKPAIGSVTAAVADPGPPPVTPSASAVRAAERYAGGREGLVSFATIDSRGRMHGLAPHRPYASASVVKTLLLAAELRRLGVADAPIDDGTRTLLARMITYSDNDSADAIYSRVGDAGLYRVAEDAGIRSFTISGYWANAQITAGDMALFMSRLDRAIPAGKREFGLSVLEDVVPEQSWGIREAAGWKWSVRFKGGWRSTELGALVHQAAELRHEDGSRTSIAVLTDAQPSQDYGIETVLGVAERLLGRQSTRIGAIHQSK
ncbi:MAG: serine hydrolase, partial [Solirubrobacterales bacterium]